MNEMKLWLLRPLRGSTAWEPWYDKAFGFVVRAETEAQARALANLRGGDELRSSPSVWLDTHHSSCDLLTYEGEAEVIIEDFHAA